MGNNPEQYIPEEAAGFKAENPPTEETLPESSRGELSHGNSGIMNRRGFLGRLIKGVGAIGVASLAERAGLSKSSAKSEEVEPEASSAEYQEQRMTDGNYEVIFNDTKVVVQLHIEGMENNTEATNLFAELKKLMQEIGGARFVSDGEGKFDIRFSYKVQSPHLSKNVSMSERWDRQAEGDVYNSATGGLLRIPGVRVIVSKIGQVLRGVNQFHRTYEVAIDQGKKSYTYDIVGTTVYDANAEYYTNITVGEASEVGHTPEKRMKVEGALNLQSGRHEGQLQYAAMVAFMRQQGIRKVLGGVESNLRKIIENQKNSGKKEENKNNLLRKP